MTRGSLDDVASCRPTAGIGQGRSDLPPDGSFDASCRAVSSLLPPHGRKPEQHDATTRRKLSTTQRVENGRAVERERRSEDSSGRRDGSAIEPGVREDKDHSVDSTIPRLERDPSNKRLRGDESCFELGGRDAVAVGNRLIPGPLVTSITDRHLASDAEWLTHPGAKGGGQARMARVAERFAARIRTNGEVESDDRAQFGCEEDVEPRREPAFDPTQLGWRDPCGRCDEFERESGCLTCNPQLAAKIGKEPPAFPGAARGVRFGHPRIVTIGAYRPLNRAATILP